MISKDLQIQNDAETLTHEWSIIRLKRFDIDDDFFKVKQQKLLEQHVKEKKKKNKKTEAYQSTN